MTYLIFSNKSQPTQEVVKLFMKILEVIAYYNHTRVCMILFLFNFIVANTFILALDLQ